MARASDGTVYVPTVGWIARAQYDALRSQGESDTWDPDLNLLIARLGNDEIERRILANLCLKCGLRPCQDDFWSCPECDPNSPENQGEDEIGGRFTVENQTEFGYTQVFGSDPSGTPLDKAMLIEGLLNEQLINEEEAKALAELSYDELLASIKSSWDEELRRKRR